MERNYFGNAYLVNLERYAKGAKVVAAIKQATSCLEWRYTERKGKDGLDIRVKEKNPFGISADTVINPRRPYCQIAFTSEYQLNGELRALEDEMKRFLEKSGITSSRSRQRSRLHPGRVSK